MKILEMEGKEQAAKELWPHSGRTKKRLKLKQTWPSGIP